MLNEYRLKHSALASERDGKGKGELSPKAIIYHEKLLGLKNSS